MLELDTQWDRYVSALVAEGVSESDALALASYLEGRTKFPGYLSALQPRLEPICTRVKRRVG